ncbi:hypothetical protein Ancab_005077 [Ancistrocladus abbreviatus]
MMEEVKECFLSFSSSKDFVSHSNSLRVLYVVHRIEVILQRCIISYQCLQKDWFIPRFYIAAATDNMSLQKACVFENSNNEVAGIKWSSIFYVESIARVRRLSLSGLLLYKPRIADQIYVQWPQLKE